MHNSTVAVTRQNYSKKATKREYYSILRYHNDQKLIGIIIHNMYISHTVKNDLLISFFFWWGGGGIMDDV